MSVDALGRYLRDHNLPTVIDVRSRDEIANAHVPGAVHIPGDELASRPSMALDDLA